MDLTEIKTTLRNNFKVDGISMMNVNNGILFKTKHGDILIVDDALKYYYTVFNENIQKMNKYEGYVDTVPSWLVLEDYAQKTNKLKEISKWFNISELFAENYSVVSQWLSNDMVSKDMLSKMYSAYSREDLSVLDGQVSDIYNKTIDKSISYYVVLLKIFYIFDKVIFNR